MTTTTDYRIVVIDDLRTPAPGTNEPEGGNIVVELHRSLSDGLAAVQQAMEQGERIDELWLDHDLGFNPDAEFGYETIMPLVDMLEIKATFGIMLDVGEIFVHTANPAAAPRMLAALQKFYKVSIAELPLAEKQELDGDEFQ